MFPSNKNIALGILAEVSYALAIIASSFIAGTIVFVIFK